MSERERETEERKTKPTWPNLGRAPQRRSMGAQLQVRAVLGGGGGPAAQRRGCFSQCPVPVQKANETRRDLCASFAPGFRAGPRRDLGAGRMPARLRRLVPQIVTELTNRPGPDGLGRRGCFVRLTLLPAHHLLIL